MEAFFEMIDSYMPFILLGMGALLFILMISIIMVGLRLKKLRKRYEFFMGANRRPDYNLETLLHNYYDQVAGVNSHFEELLEKVAELEKNLTFCTQKVGIVRYNPFDQMGGNLCFAVALLDAQNNGVVFNGIHSRNSSFTYAKPVTMGVSKYVLSSEEKQAIQEAIDNAFVKEKAEIKIDKPRKIYHLKARKIKTLDEMIHPEEAAAAAEEEELERIIEENERIKNQERERLIDSATELEDEEIIEDEMEDFDTTEEDVNEEKEIELKEELPMEDNFEEEELIEEENEKDAAPEKINEVNKEEKKTKFNKSNKSGEDIAPEMTLVVQAAERLLKEGILDNVKQEEANLEESMSIQAHGRRRGRLKKEEIENDEKEGDKA